MVRLRRLTVSRLLVAAGCASVTAGATLLDYAAGLIVGGTLSAAYALLFIDVEEGRK